MSGLGNKIKNNLHYICVFAAPWILIVLHSFIRLSWLSGEGSILNDDTGLQLYPLMVELWNKVHAGESLFFSWNAGCGIDFYLNMAYYLMSPFNLIVLLLPKAWIENTVQFVMVLKWSLMGVTAVYYFVHTRYNQLTANKKLLSAVLGLAFVFSNSILMVFGYFNWSDVILLFPLVLLKLEDLMESGKWKWYYILLTASMLCNFYMAYQMCVFLFFWFVIHLNSDIRDKFRKFLLFAGSSVLAAVSSLVVIFPAVMASGQRIGEGNMQEWINGFFDFGQRLFLFCDGLTDWTAVQPNLFFSTGFLVCMALYFSVKISKAEKFKTTVFCVFILFSLCNRLLTMFWHGFSIPYGIYHRYLSMFIFLMLFMAMRSFCELATIKMWKLLVTVGLEIAYMAACFLKIQDFQNFYGYFITFLLLILYNLLIFFFLRGSIRHDKLLLTFSLLIVIELSANAWYEFKDYDVTTWDDLHSTKSVANMLDSVDLEQGERADLLNVAKNAGLAYDLPGTNQFVSYNNSEMVKFFDYMGMGFSPLSNYAVQGASPLLNLMFNLRYGAGIWEGCFSDGETVRTEDDAILYRIERLAGLGYMVDSRVTEWQPEQYANFDLQNDFADKAAGESEIFTNYLPEVRFTDGILDYKCNEEMYNQGYFFYDYTSKTMRELEVTEFSFFADESMDLYIDLFSSSPTDTIICVDNQILFADKITNYQNYYHVGQVESGQQIVVYNKHHIEPGQSAKLWFRLAGFNEENYAKVYEKLSKNVYQIDRMDETYVSGTIHADEDGIMMTSIPAMEGFTVYVDGSETECNAIGRVFFGVPLTAGDHTVEFKYRTPYFTTGMIGSIIGFVLFGIMCLIGKMSKKTPDEEEKTPEQVMGEA